MKHFGISNVQILFTSFNLRKFLKNINSFITVWPWNQHFSPNSKWLHFAAWDQTKQSNYGQAWSDKPKMIITLWRNLRYWSSGKKITSSFTFSLTYCKLAILGTLGMLFTHTQSDTINLYKFSSSCLSVCFMLTQEPEFCQTWNWWGNINNNLSFHFRLFPEKTNDKIFQKIQKTLFWSYFGPFLPKFRQKWIFLEKRAPPVFKCSNYLQLS